MISFKTFLKEAVESTQHLKHLTHVEDHPLNHGAEGYEHAKKTLHAVHNSLTGTGETHGVSTTEKFDGAPSIVYGHHPESGKFFVASKSAFNKNPKINYSHADIEKNHGHAPGLVDKLKTAYTHLQKVAPKTGVYQGDMMHSGASDVEDHGSHYSFTPNTVTHSVPKHSEEGKKIAKSKMGIVTHTKYEGTSLDNMKAGFDVDHHNFKQHADVHQVNPSMKFNGKYSKDSQNAFKTHMRKAEEHHQKIGNNYSAFDGHSEHLNTYINKTVRTGEKPSVQGYQSHLGGIGEREAGKVKTEKTKQAKMAHYTGLQNHVEKHAEHFNNLLNMHHHLGQAKHHLVNALSTHDRGMSYSIGGKSSKPEGYVSTIKDSKGESYPSKLVDRSSEGFAAANLQGGRFQKK